MPTSLYDATVPGFLRGVEAVEGILQRGVDHYTDAGRDPNELVTASLHDDMLPFSFQIASVAHHSMGALKGAAAGAFAPPAGYNTNDFAGMRALLAETKEYLQGLDAGAVNVFDEGDLVFNLGDNKIPFTKADFLLGFNIPNFHFHATTAYDILRMKGVPLGKRDYLGRLPIKHS